MPTKPFILIIDDDEEVAMMLSSYLQALGYDAAVALNGMDAKARIGARRPNVILMDFRMPGSSGSQLHDELQRMPHASQVPVIFISAISPEEAQKVIPQTPRTRFLKKPVDVKRLQQFITELLPMPNNSGAA